MWEKLLFICVSFSSASNCVCVFFFLCVCVCVCVCVCSEPVVTGKKAREREGKWLKMLSEWDFWMEKYPAKVCV